MASQNEDKWKSEDKQKKKKWTETYHTTQRKEQNDEFCKLRANALH